MAYKLSLQNVDAIWTVEIVLKILYIISIFTLMEKQIY